MSMKPYSCGYGYRLPRVGVVGEVAESVKLVNLTIFRVLPILQVRLGSPLAERLKHEVYQLMEEAISWWAQQDIMSAEGW
ncbi:MAG: hypothetical protein QXI18_02935 [Nitrososphaerota archaeon]